MTTPAAPVTGPQTGLFSFSFVSLDGNQGVNNVAFTGHAYPTPTQGNSGFVNGPVPPAPEPSTVAPFALAGLGLLGLTLRARKRSQSA